MEPDSLLLGQSLEVHLTVVEKLQQCCDAGEGVVVMFTHHLETEPDTHVSMAAVICLFICFFLWFLDVLISN